MKPCLACQMEYGEFLCNELGHCVFEGSGEWPKAPEAPYPKHQILEQPRQIDIW